MAAINEANDTNGYRSSYMKQRPLKSLDYYEIRRFLETLKKDETDDASFTRKIKGYLGSKVYKKLDRLYLPMQEASGKQILEKLEEIQDLLKDETVGELPLELRLKKLKYKNKNSFKQAEIRDYLLQLNRLNTEIEEVEAESEKKFLKKQLKKIIIKALPPFMLPSKLTHDVTLEEIVKTVKQQYNHLKRASGGDDSSDDASETTEDNSSSDESTAKKKKTVEVINEKADNEKKTRKDRKQKKVYLPKDVYKVEVDRSLKEKQQS